MGHLIAGSCVGISRILSRAAARRTTGAVGDQAAHVVYFTAAVYIGAGVRAGGRGTACVGNVNSEGTLTFLEPAAQHLIADHRAVIGRVPAEGYRAVGVEGCCQAGRRRHSDGCPVGQR